MTVSEYLNRKYTLLNTPAIIRDGKHGASLNLRVQEIELLGSKADGAQPGAKSTNDVLDSQEDHGMPF